MEARFQSTRVAGFVPGTKIPFTGYCTNDFQPVEAKEWGAVAMVAGGGGTFRVESIGDSFSRAELLFSIEPYLAEELPPTGSRLEINSVWYEIVLSALQSGIVKGKKEHEPRLVMNLRRVK